MRILIPAFLLACAHKQPSAGSSEMELRRACEAGADNDCLQLVGMLEMEGFGPGRTRDAWELASASEGLMPAAAAVLLAEDRRDVLNLADREFAWRRICRLGFLPGCEVGAWRLREDSPDVSEELRNHACAAGWGPACSSQEPVSVEMPPAFADALAVAGARFIMPRSFHVTAPGARSSWAIESDDRRLRIGYLILDDTAAKAEDRPEVLEGIASTLGMNETGLIPRSELRTAWFPPFLVRLEYNANQGGTIVYLSGATQVMTIWQHRDPGTMLAMVLTFEDAQAATDLLPVAGHSIGFEEPIGFTGDW